MENTKNEIYISIENNKLIKYDYKINNLINLDFKLNEIEKNCFETIEKILKQNNITSTICRVAGGWVRDKLLGYDSSDIDIALSDMKGSKLATLINSEISPGKDKVGIMQINKEKGKHLETATIKINNIWIDFVNLRSYNEENIGTPIEDAELRDLSINSLFYNINNKNVEDFTNKGIQDLKNGIINTPINNSLKTFSDDTCRILRMIRFALKLKFKISDNINNCINNNIKLFRDNFYKNISNERIEKELFQILKFKNSSFCVTYLYKFNLLDVILQYNKFIKQNDDFDKNVLLNTTNIFIVCNYIRNNYNLTDNNFENKEEEERLNLGLLLLTIYFRKEELKFGKEKITLNQLILRESFKASNDILKQNDLINKHIDELINYINSHKNSYDRLSASKIIKSIKHINLVNSIYCGISLEYINIKKESDIIDNLDENLFKEIFNKYDNFFSFVSKENLFYIDDLKPLIDGSEIMKILNVSSGKHIKLLLDYILDSQIINPSYNKDNAIDYINSQKDKIIKISKEKIKEGYKKKIKK